jgi:hypothetical protein
MLLALATIAILGNLSAVQRLASIRTAVRERAREEGAHDAPIGKAAAE